MLGAVHVQRSRVAAIMDCPVFGQLIGSRSLKRFAPQGVCLFQESPGRMKMSSAVTLWAQDLVMEGSPDGTTSAAAADQSTSQLFERLQQNV